MKNILTLTKKGILIVAMLATVLGFAEGDAKVIVKRDAKKTTITLEDVKPGDLVSIKDNQGIIIFKESVETTGTYKKGFDLTELANGDYVFEIDKDLEVNTIPFKVRANEIEFDESEESTYFKPHTKKEADLLYVTKLCSNNEATIINIFNEVEQGTYKMVHSELIENTLAIKKVYKLNKGNYKITIHSNNKEYTKFINN
ncbi:hypothetical protein [Pseudotamlana carrageenivorans]|uniref:Uncharacterized protein n=1 Tax=Pseudotamlana carrageenivorans TaxID=2069432 RepID=A0A2I7SGT3_9FLAO|nr:hypothetical protein [Tamlana carrageenivorans]AUS05044.1 hypothetical protein C1A40_05990 [Tamlana carrageenivorans]